MLINVAAAAGSVASKLTGGLIHTSSTAASNAATDAAYASAVAGNQDALDSLVRKAGYGGGVGMAVGAGAKEYAQGKLLSAITSGSVTGPNPGTKTNRDMGYPKFPDLPYGTPNLVGQYKVTTKTLTPSDRPAATIVEQAAVGGLPGWAVLAILAGIGYVGFRLLKRG